MLGRLFPGDPLDRTSFPAGAVSYWFKQDEIHQATHVHGSPAFLPWHRELCNRFEAMLREVDPELSLHYWDWNTDPAPLFTKDFMGNANGEAEDPWLKAKLYNPKVVDDNYRSVSGALLNKSPPSYPKHAYPADPPKTLTRDKQAGAPHVGQFSSDGRRFWPTDDQLTKAKTFQEFNDLMQGFEIMESSSKNGAHGLAHEYIGGTIGSPHTSFRDPFVFLLHSNVDRLWAMWQVADPKRRLDPEQVYGSDSSHPSITDPLQPWAGEDDWKSTLGWPVRPWYTPDNEQVRRTCKDVVTPPVYDTTYDTTTPKDGPGAVLFGKDQRKGAVFGRGTDNLLWYRKKDNVFELSDWGPWQFVEGEINSNPCATTFGEDYLMVLASRPPDNSLWYRFYDGDTWADWAPLGGELQ